MPFDQALAEETAAQRAHLTREQLNLWRIAASLRATDTAIENGRRACRESIAPLENVDRSAH